MEESTSKEKILKKIRSALISTRENPFIDIDFISPVYNELSDVPVVSFAMNLKEAGGVFVYCENEKALVDNLKVLIKEKKWKEVFTLDNRIARLLKNEEIKVKSGFEKQKKIDAGITFCDFLVARFGSVVVSSALSSGRRMFAFPEAHIVFATASQVVSELKDALTGLKKKYPGGLPSQITVIRGPSRTADIEKTLVMGAHGPRELYVFMVDDL